MCFTQSISFLFGIIGVISSAYFYKNNYPKNAYIPILYFASMEFLQCAQYSVIDDCSSVWNKILTTVGYTHMFSILIYKYLVRLFYD